MASKSNEDEVSYKRKLKRMSTKELLKLCKSKKIKIKSTASKTEMIGKLVLNFIKEKENEKKKAALQKKKEKKQQADLQKIFIGSKSEYMSMVQFSNLIVSAFIHDIEKQKKDNRITPSSLFKIIMDYSKGAVTLHFDLCDDRFLDGIKDNGFIIRRSAHSWWQQDIYDDDGSYHGYYCNNNIIYGCSSGFKPKTGIHKFSIKINNKLGLDEQIGIISNKKKIFRANPSKNDNQYSLKSVACDSYFITNSYPKDKHEFVISTSNYNNKNYIISPKLKYYTAIKKKLFDPYCHKNDIISVCLDSDVGKLYFAISKNVNNENMIKKTYKICEPFNIDPNLTYYPCMCTLCAGNEFELVYI